MVRRMFSDIEADVYVLVDGDATYDAPSARAMIAAPPRRSGSTWWWACASIARRAPTGAATASATGCSPPSSPTCSATPSGTSFPDIGCSRAVSSSPFPALSGGFEIETELTAHALVLELPVAEIETPYYARPAGSLSKLNTWRDGMRILSTIVKLYRSERPLGFFSAIGVSLAIMAVGIAMPIFVTYLQEGVVPRLPTAVLSTGLMMIAALAIACGLVLDTVTRGRREVKRLAYLSHRPPGDEFERRDRVTPALRQD